MEGLEEMQREVQEEISSAQSPEILRFMYKYANFIEKTGSYRSEI